MRKIVLLFLIVSLSAHAAKIEPGVSRELAQERAMTVSHVAYNLAFSIPNEKSQPVTGSVTLTFSWSGTDDLQIDFSGDSVDLACEINQQSRKISWQSEHLIVPAKYLNKGDNEIKLKFTVADKALNRSDEYLYTLFVPAHAHSVFPCFDQPNIKALFALNLTLPEGWTYISSADSHLLPTYLFSFSAGKFKVATANRGGRTLKALYRETDEAKISQLDSIFDEAALSLKWMEEYTGVPYPFDKYGFVILPGYQFGGMEHPGAIQFNDRTIFLNANPTPDERINRLKLIAHETAHMWFGDLVTMDWFDDVWTKEVFANTMAAKVGKTVFPNYNDSLNFLRAYQMGALAVDRTDGTHPIQQPLENLKDAGLLYGNIIYDKAPVVMRILEGLVGEDNMRQSLRAYLKRYAYGNATWDNLIAIMDSVSPQSNVKEFSRVWVKEKGMPTITQHYENGKLIIEQQDPFGRGLIWPQKFKTGLLMADGKTVREVEVNMNQARCEVTVLKKPYAILPNYDGSGYGRFVCDSLTNAVNEYSWSTFSNPLLRQASLMTLYENYLMHRVKPSEYLNSMNTYLMNEEHPLVASTLCSYLSTATNLLDKDSRKYFEYYLYNDAVNHMLPSVRQKLMRFLSQTCLSPTVTDSIYNRWRQHDDSLLSERDYTNMAYHLAIMKPSAWQEILSTQRSRIKNVDEQRAFDFISRACNPDQSVQRQLFLSLLKAENRTVEPWASHLLSLLSCQAREPRNNEYLPLGLNALVDIQRTGDIFFPSDWLNSLLSGHNSHEAKFMVKSWIANHAAYPQNLMNKVKQQAFMLLHMK